jgi:5-methylcytosine-specific restriction endonuclease McrA
LLEGKTIHKATNPFYFSRRWRTLRQAVLRRDGYRCQVCRCDVSGPGMARVDHVKPMRTHPHLALNPANLRTLCSNHDNQSHREKGRRSSGDRDEMFVISGCDANGRPLDPSHHWQRPGPNDL